jgi:hypothetical protein
VKNKIVGIIILLTLMLVTVSYVKADIVDVNGEDLARAPYIQSPTNTTYTSDSLTLAVNFYADWFKAWDYSINYSLDGKRNQTLSLEFFGQSGVTNVSVVSVPIRNLSEGTHHLTVYIKLATSTKTYYDSQTVVFTVATNQSIATNQPSTSVPEFPALITVPLLVSIFSIALLLKYRKIRSKDGNGF